MVLNGFNKLFIYVYYKMNNLFSNIQQKLNMGLNNNSASLLQQQITSQNKINDLLEKSASAIACGPSCQKEKKIGDLKQKYLDAQVNLQNAPALLEQAKKNYYVYTEGEPAYASKSEAELKTEAATIAKTATDIFTLSVKNALTLNDGYNIALVNSEHTENYLHTLEKDNSDLKKRLGNKYSDVLTNNRKTYYEQNGITDLQYWYNFWWYIYYLLVFVFILAIFLANSTMTRLTILIVTILLVFYPYYIHPIVLKVWSTIKAVNKLWPKNVYNDL